MSILSRREFAIRAAAFGAVSSVGMPFAGLDKRKKKQEVVATAEQAAPFKPSISGADSLRAHAEAVGLHFGVAVQTDLLDLRGVSGAGTSDAYTSAVLTQADMLVAESAMKWRPMRPTATTYNFDDADKLFAFASSSGQLVRGHNLCWHEELPDWFMATVNQDNAKDYLTDHISQVAGRYAGRVHSWDVVNEAVHVPDGRADGLRQTPWLDLLGPEYIEIAFRAAAKADPAAKLTYNETNFELDTPEHTAKRGQVLALLRRLHARNVPVHAVGLQSHLQAAGPQPGPGLVDFVREVGKLGMEVYVTEMDVNTHALDGDDAAQDVSVAQVYHSYLAMLLPEPNVKAVLTWGLSDAKTWLNVLQKPWITRADGRRQRPLPLDENFQPKEAFFQIRDAFDGSRQGLKPTDITVPQGPQGDPWAPFAVPGSPKAMPKI